MVKVEHAHLFEGLSYSLTIGFGGSSAQPYDAESSHEDHVVHRKGKSLGEVDALGHIPYGPLLLPGRPVEDRDGPHGRAKGPENQPQKCGFPSAVGSDQSGERASGNLQGDPLENGPPPV
jgi:hypothetical protein